MCGFKPTADRNRAGEWPRRESDRAGSTGRGFSGVGGIVIGVSGVETFLLWLEACTGDLSLTYPSGVARPDLSLLPDRGLVCRLPNPPTKAPRLVLRPCPLPSKEPSFEMDREELELGSAADDIFSTLPPPRFSSKEDMGKSDIFCWFSTSSRAYERASATQAKFLRRVEIRHPGNSISRTRRASSLIRTSLVLFLTHIITTIPFSSSLAVLLRSTPPTHVQFGTVVLLKAGLSSGKL